MRWGVPDVDRLDGLGTWVGKGMKTIEIMGGGGWGTLGLIKYNKLIRGRDGNSQVTKMF